MGLNSSFKGLSCR